MRLVRARSRGASYLQAVASTSQLKLLPPPEHDIVRLVALLMFAQSLPYSPAVYPYQDWTACISANLRVAPLPEPLWEWPSKHILLPTLILLWIASKPVLSANAGWQQKAAAMHAKVFEIAARVIPIPGKQSYNFEFGRFTCVHRVLRSEIGKNNPNASILTHVY